MRLYKVCFLKRKQTHEDISYLNARTGVLNIIKKLINNSGAKHKEKS